MNYPILDGESCQLQDVRPDKDFSLLVHYVIRSRRKHMQVVSLGIELVLDLINFTALEYRFFTIHYSTTPSRQQTAARGKGYGSPLRRPLKAGPAAP